MLRSRLNLKVLGLCSLVLGLMVLASSSTQAEIGAFWSVVKANGELVKIPGVSDLLPQLEIKEVENKTLSFLYDTGVGIKVTILCTAMAFDEGGKLTANGGISLGRLLLKGCSATINEMFASVCKPKSGGAPRGELLSEKFTGLIVLDKLASGEVEDFIKITPENSKGETSKILFLLDFGEECPFKFLNIEAKTLGEGLWLKDGGGNKSFQEEKVEHLFEESLHGLAFDNRSWIIDGSFWIRLAFEHQGLKWGGTPA
jgi:hypothetical protein